jgi:hypothetical protein
MKPNFALSLSFEGIRLLHRTAVGWRQVGAVDTDVPDLTAQLASLRQKALALDPAGLRCKLILPNDQIKYIALDSARATEDEVREALDGSTAMTLDELVYDFTRGGGRTYVAAVARQTLEEAEAFARSHKMGPVCFVAVPEEFTFVGEPFFGPSSVAGALLPPGEEPERDDEAVVEIKDAAEEDDAPVAALPAWAKRKSEEESKDAPEPKPAKAEVTEAAAEADIAESKTDEKSEAPAAKAAQTEPAEPEAKEAKTEHAKPERAEATRHETDHKAEAPEEATEEATEAGTPSPGEDGPLLGAASPSFFRAATRPAPAAKPKDEPRTEEVSTAKPAASAAKAPAQPTSEPEAPKAAPKAPLAAERQPSTPPQTAPPVFASRRNGHATNGAKPAPPPLSRPDKSAPAERVEPPLRSAGKAAAKMPPLAVARDAAPRPSAAAEMRVPLEPPVQTASPVTAAHPAPEETAPFVTGRPGTALPEGEAPAPAMTLADRFRRKEPLDDMPSPRVGAPPIPDEPIPPKRGLFSRGAKPAEVPVTPKSTPIPPPPKEADTERDRMTVFGARPKGEAVAVGGKPKYLGLILTILLLLAMLAVAALASTISEETLARWFGRSDPTEVEVVAADPPPEAAPTEVLPELPPDAIALVPFDEAPPVEQEVAAAPEPAEELPEQAAMLLSPAEAERFYAATGVWVRGPVLPLQPRSEDVGLPVQVAEPTRPAIAGDVIALDATTGPDSSLPLQRTPPPPGTVFPRDSRGFFLATPEGTVTPDGLVIYAGQPALTPPTRPGTEAPPPPPEPAPEDVAAPDPVTEAVPAPDLAPEAAPETVPPGQVVASAPDALPTTDLTPVTPAPPEFVDTDAVNLVAGAPPVVPPTRPGTTLPEEPPAAEVAVAEPFVDTDVVNLISGTPPVVPPTRPGTVVPEEAAATPETEVPFVDTDAINLIAGAPPVEPPTRPGTVVPSEEAAPDTAPETAPDTAAEATPGGVALDALVPEGEVTVLAGFDGPRPIVRSDQAVPIALIPTPPYDGLRPSLRPEDLAPEETPEEEVVEEEPEETPVAPDVGSTLASIVAGAPDPLAGVTRFAVARAVRPDSRPRNFDRVVARAIANAPSQAAPQTAAAPPSGGDTGGTQVSAAPARPSGNVPTSVASAATSESAINLREVNLIGVYGRPGDRRALIRLGNGRYVRVGVGDRLEGGQVTAIGDNALNYVVRGRTYALQIPDS